MNVNSEDSNIDISQNNEIKCLLSNRDVEDAVDQQNAIDNDNISVRSDVTDDRVCLIPDPVPNCTTSYGSIQGPSEMSSFGGAYDKEISEKDDLCLMQAQVFLEDAALYRTIDHKVDMKSLKLYQFYHSKPFAWLRTGVIFILHILAFFEFPSSLSWTSDIRRQDERIQLPCGVTEGIELMCLLFLLLDVVLKTRIYGYKSLYLNKWLFVEIVVLCLSFIDWIVSMSVGCGEVVRIRRMIRPVFIIQNSSLMKKILNSLRKTMSQILGVLLLMALHLYVFTLLGMLLFPKPKDNDTIHDINNLGELNDILIPSNSSGNGTKPSESTYFRTLTESFMSLLVLLTTANNPDVTLPAYTRNRLYAIFFILFLTIGLYCFMNMLTAIIYNQFRDYFKNSMQSSLMRRRLGQRAAFEALKYKSMQLNHSSSLQDKTSEDSQREGVSSRDLKVVISRAKIEEEIKVTLIDTIARGFTQDQIMTWINFLSVLKMTEMEKDHKEKPRIRWFTHHPRLVALQKIVCHKGFSYFGNVMALINVILITIELATEYDKSLSSSKSALRIINFLFILYYVVEQSLIVICMGWRRYKYSWSNIYDGSIVLILLLSELVTVALYGFPFFSQREIHGNFTLWNIVRVINILIMFRLLRIIWHIQAMAIVAHTLLDLVKNLQSFGGILIVIYYSYAMLGMEIFQNKITYPTKLGNESLAVCGTYEQLEYWANNFDDFAAAVVVLWDVMVVNNWFVFLDAYAKYTTKWSYVYFIIWWLMSVVIVLNLFTALILENFIMKWDKFYDHSRSEGRRRRSLSRSISMNTLTVHDIFRSNLTEPSEEEVVDSLSKLKYFRAQS
ncbi:Two pore calcium channel protein 2 [Mactra antiquata]